MGELRRTGEVHRKRVKQLEQELLSQRIIAKVLLLYCAADPFVYAVGGTNITV